MLGAEFVALTADGSVATVPAAQVGVDAFEGASSGLIGGDDIALVAGRLTPGAVGLVLV